MRAIIWFTVWVILAAPVAAIAGQISIVGGERLDVMLRDADRVQALAALFATARGKRTLQLGEGVGGRVEKLLLSQATFDEALAAILGPDLVYRQELRAGVNAYRVGLPVDPRPAPEPAPLVTVEADAAAPDTEPPGSIFSTVLRITSRAPTGTPAARSGATTSTRSARAAAPRSYSIHATESVPFIIMDERFDPFGNIIRRPQIYWQTFGSGFTVNGIGNISLDPPGPMRIRQVYPPPDDVTGE